MGLVEDYASEDEDSEDNHEEFKESDDSSDEDCEATNGTTETGDNQINSTGNGAQRSLLPSADDAFSKVDDTSIAINQVIELQNAGPIPAAEQARKFHLENLAKVAKAEEDAQAIEDAKRAAMTISAKPVRTVAGSGDEEAPPMVWAGKSQDAAWKAQGKTTPMKRNVLLGSGEKGAVKEREKVKRARGQSSHQTWKSEAEMINRQRFDD